MACVYLKSFFKMTKEITKWIIKHRIHLIGWTLFILSEVLFIGFAAAQFGKPIAYLLHYTLNVLLFYINTSILLKTNCRKTYWQILVLTTYLISELILFVFLKALIDASLLEHSEKSFFYFVNLPYLLQTTFRVLFFIGLSCFYFMFIQYKKERNEKENIMRHDLEASIKNKELEIALQQATNAYLKAQINPHFMFNVLGFIHDSVLKTESQAAQAIIDLSELMRFAVNSGSGEEEPPLAEEIQQVESLIRLYQQRFKDRVFVEFSYNEDAGDCKLIPLVLLTLVENLFKHGDIHSQDDPAKINISTDANAIKITTYNLKKDANEPKGFNKGLQNILTRLEHNYPQRFEMNYGEKKGKYFYVEIKVTTLSYQ